MNHGVTVSGHIVMSLMSGCTLSIGDSAYKEDGADKFDMAIDLRAKVLGGTGTLVKVTRGALLQPGTYTNVEKLLMNSGSALIFQEEGSEIFLNGFSANEGKEYKHRTRVSEDITSRPKITVDGTMVLNSQVTLTGDMDVSLAGAVVVSIGSAGRSSEHWQSPTVVTAEVNGPEASVTIRRRTQLNVGKRTVYKHVDAGTETKIQFVKDTGVLELNYLTMDGGDSGAEKPSTITTDNDGCPANAAKQQRLRVKNKMTLHSNLLVSGRMRVELTNDNVQVFLGTAGVEAAVPATKLLVKMRGDPEIAAGDGAYFGTTEVRKSAHVELGTARQD